MRYFIELGYKGTAYHGWQIQENAVTIQEILNHALSCLLKTPITTLGQGRTDTGVHCKKMFAHFDYEYEINEELVSKMNHFIPKDIVVYSIRNVNEKAHARFDAISRTYEYHFHLAKNPFCDEVSVYLNRIPDINLLQLASNILIKDADYECFSKKGVTPKTYFCNISEAHWKFNGQTLVFTIKANRFLRNMVRAIVGTLLDVGNKKITLEDLQQIIDSKNRSKASSSAPAKGLFLMNQEYPNWIWKN